MEVEDTGIGIKENEQKKLFKIFGKLKDTENINSKGVGLGLSICKKITEFMGGGITIESS